MHDTNRNDRSADMWSGSKTLENKDVDNKTYAPDPTLNNGWLCTRDLRMKMRWRTYTPFIPKEDCVCG